MRNMQIFYTCYFNIILGMYRHDGACVDMAEIEIAGVFITFKNFIRD